MKKIILIVGGVIIVAVAGRLIWAYQQVQNDEARMANAPVVATTTPEPVQTNSLVSNQVQNAVVPATKETETQRDIKIIQTEISSCKSKYGDIPYCSQNSWFVGVIDSCLKYVGNSTKAKECAIEQYKLVQSGLPQMFTGRPPLSQFFVWNFEKMTQSRDFENENVGTLICVDKNNPSNGPLIDPLKAKKFVTTNTEAMIQCESALYLNQRAVCEKADVSLFTKCSEGVLKYGSYHENREVQVITTKYGGMLRMSLLWGQPPM